MTALTDLQQAQHELASNLGGFLGVFELMAHVDDALRPPSPQGSPAEIASCAKQWHAAAIATSPVSADLKQVATSTLPSAWSGQVADTASQDISALSAEVQATSGVLARASAALQTWSDDLTAAQSDDRIGGGLLVEVGESLRAAGPGCPDSALQRLHATACTGVGLRVAGAQLALSGAHTAATLLYELGQQARAERGRSGSIDAISSIVLANQSVNGTPLLSASAMARAEQRMAAMSPADRARFQALLAGCRSPEEAAFLMKVLAAGHSVGQVEQFDGVIHAHGDDAAWLAKHLVPDISGTPGSDGHYFAQYGGNTDTGVFPGSVEIFDQGRHNDCVAASTVIAQASVDPSVMLALTTGGKVGGDDSDAAFQARLQQTYLGQYAQGQRADGQIFPGDNGLGPKGEDKLADQDLGTTTGGNYDYQSLNTTSDRQDAVTNIEHSVDQGKPVPLDITNGKEGHQVMVIGHDGDRLQIYNPWGYTTWVTESQFVNNDLGSVTSAYGDGSLKTSDGVELPH